MRSLAIFVLSTACVSAQGGGDSLAATLVRNIVHDQKVLWTSPLHIKREQAAGLVAFGAVTAALIATDARVSNALPNTDDQIAVCNAISRIGAAYTTFGVAGGWLLVGRLTGNERAQETGLLGVEVLADTAAVSGLLKLATNRERPYQDDGRGHFWAGGKSFPSGHAISSWGLAEVIADEYHEKPLVRVGAYSLATLVSLSRIGARKHFPSDVFVGSAAGLLIGRYVYHTHHDPDRKWSLRPLAHVDPVTHTYAVSLVWSTS